MVIDDRQRFGQRTAQYNVWDGPPARPPSAIQNNWSISNLVDEMNETVLEDEARAGAQTIKVTTKIITREQVMREKGDLLKRIGNRKYNQQDLAKEILCRFNRYHVKVLPEAEKNKL